MLFLSRYAYFFQKASVTACYHSLRIMPVYIPDVLLPMIKRFNEGAVLENLTGNFAAEKEKREFLIAVEALKKAKVLIEDPKEDKDAINYFRELTGKPYPHLAYFILTGRCNFRCKYCFIKNQEDLEYNEKDMTKEVAFKGLDFFCRLIAEDSEQFDLEKTIVFYGGEPLLSWPVLDALLGRIRTYIKERKLPRKTTLNIVTNGSLLTPNIAETLRKHNVQVSISIDGDDSATNLNRVYGDGRPVYQDIKRGFQVCKDAGMNVGASCTLSVASISDFNTTISVLLDECGVTNLGLNLMISGEEKLKDGYSEKAAKFIIDAFQVFRERGIYEDRIMRKANAFLENTVWPFDCGATGGNQIVIAPNGDVGICHGFIAERKYFPTNVNDRGFNIRENEDYKEWSKRSPLNMPECQNCPALGICGGGCPFQAEIEKGSIWALDERFCIHSKMTLEWLIWDLFEKTQET